MMTSMTTPDRRQLLATAAAGTLAAALPACASRGTAIESSSSLDYTPAGPARLRILILGGTGFLGPALVEAARPRGHEVVLFNRGKTNPGLFPELEKLRGDRDPSKGAGIKSLEGRAFDVVFDDSGYFPRHVAASAELLRANGTKRYVFVSSISCYASNDIEGADETTACGTLADPAVEEFGAQFEYYGPLKAACEEAAKRSFGAEATIVRPGFIVGPGDPTDRFTYWPVRFARGGVALVPGTPSDPLQVIDVRDLAAFMLRLAEDGTSGTFNACGPARRLTFGELVESCRAATQPDAATPRWLPLESMASLGTRLDFPLWVPYAEGSRGFHTWSNARAVAAGLAFRPLDATIADTLSWWRSQPSERIAKLRAGLSAEQEAAVLAKLA